MRAVSKQRLLRRHAEFLQLGGNVGAVRAGGYVLVDEEDLAIRANVMRVTKRNTSIFVHNAVGRGHFLSRIAENRVIEVQRLGEPLVLFGGIAACGEVNDVELTKGVAALTERLAFLRSAAGESFGIPSDHYSLALKLGELVSFAVAAGQFKRRCGISDFQFSRCGIGHEHPQDKWKSSQTQSKTFHQLDLQGG